MCDSKNESRCSAKLLKTPCCTFVNQAITAYFREATGVLSTGVAAITAAFPQALTATQTRTLRLSADDLVNYQANTNLNQGEANAVNNAIAILVPGVPFTPFVQGNPMSAAQVGAISAIFGFATPDANNPVPAPLTSANIAGIASALDILVPNAGLGDAFTASFATTATEAATRVTALKATFDEINRLVLAGFQELLDDKCNDECCETASEALRSIAINFLRSAASAAPSRLPALPPPAPDTPATSGSLQFVLANIVQETSLSIRAVTSGSDCDKSCNEKCEEKKKKKKCERRRFKLKPTTRKVEEDSDSDSSSSSECESEEKKYKMCNKKKEDYDDCTLAENWKFNVPDVKW